MRNEGKRIRMRTRDGKFDDETNVKIKTRYIIY